MRPSLDQKSELLRVLQTDEGISKHFELDGDNGWDFVSKLTLGQYKYICTLIGNKHRTKLNQFFIQQGVRGKI